VPQSALPPNATAEIRFQCYKAWLGWDVLDLPGARVVWLAPRLVAIGIMVLDREHANGRDVPNFVVEGAARAPAVADATELVLTALACRLPLFACAVAVAPVYSVTRAAPDGPRRLLLPHILVQGRIKNLLRRGVRYKQG
jgi:hypothetical protein